MISKYSLVLAATSLMLLSGCEGSEVKRSLGLDKRAPDEFMVLSRPPLTVPPDFNLRAPEDITSQRRSEVQDEARKTLLGSKTESAVGKSSGENLLLERAGANRATSDIRAVLDQENQPKQPVEEESFWSGIFDPITAEKPDAIVDPVAERERIAQQKAAGEVITGDDAVTTKPRDRGILDRIF